MFSIGYSTAEGYGIFSHLILMINVGLILLQILHDFRYCGNRGQNGGNEKETSSGQPFSG